MKPENKIIEAIKFYYDIKLNGVDEDGPIEDIVDKLNDNGVVIEKVFDTFIKISSVLGIVALIAFYNKHKKIFTAMGISIAVLSIFIQKLLVMDNTIVDLYKTNSREQYIDNVTDMFRNAILNNGSPEDPEYDAADNTDKIN